MSGLAFPAEDATYRTRSRECVVSLWRCPNCGHRFVTRNLWHSCARHRLTEHFAGKPPILRATFRRWSAIARGCGPVTVYAQKTRIVIQARVRFAGAVVRERWIDASLWLKRRVTHPCLHRIEDLGRLGYGIHFRLTAPADIDRALGTLMREAYAAAVGHSKRGTTPERAARPGGPRRRA